MVLDAVVLRQFDQLSRRDGLSGPGLVAEPAPDFDGVAEDGVPAPP